jgi:eukaryotic-like serine/threonine-protein kinase
MSLNTSLFSIIKVALLCLIVVVIIGLIVAFAVIPSIVRTKDAVVPDLVGQPYEQAFQQLYEAGLQLDVEGIEQKPSTKVPARHVIEQVPTAGANVKPNKRVKITLSAGDQALATPNLQGKQLGEAEALLKDKGFQRGRVAEVHSDRYPGTNTVITQTPSAGTLQPRSGTVNLLLSLGRRPKVLLMPDLRGEPIDEVRAQLQSYGLTIQKEEYKLHPEIPSGAIITHQPVAGEFIEVGTAIALEVSGSPRTRTDTGRQVIIKHTVSGVGVLSKYVEVAVEDERGRRTIIKGWYDPGILINPPPTKVFGEAFMLVYEDEKIVKRERL